MKGVPKNKIDRKLTRVGGSVTVAIPKEVRREVGLVVGDRVNLWAVDNKYIVIEKSKGVLGEGVCIRD